MVRSFRDKKRDYKSSKTNRIRAVFFSRIHDLFLRYFRLHYRDILLFFSDRKGSEMNTPFDLILDFNEINVPKFHKESFKNPKYLDSERLKNILERHERGDRVLTLSQPNGEIVHYSWVRIMPGSIEIRDINVLIEDVAEGDLVVVFDCWTAPSMRGQGLYPWAIRYLANRAIQTGNTCWIHCMRWNLASRKGIETAGFRLYQSYKRFVVFPNHLKWKRFATSSKPLKPISC